MLSPFVFHSWMVLPQQTVITDHGYITPAGIWRASGMSVYSCTCGVLMLSPFVQYSWMALTQQPVIADHGYKTLAGIW